MSRVQASALVLIAAAVWGVAFYFQKIAMDHLGAATFLGFRALLAAVTLAPFALWEQARSDDQRKLLAERQTWRYAGQGGVIFLYAGMTQQLGLVEATVTNAGFLTALYVVFTPFLVWQLQRQRITATVWGASALSFLGIWALGGGNLSGFNTGDMLVAASALGWAAFMVNVAASTHLARPILMTCLTFACAAVMCGVVAMVFETVTWAAVTEALVPVLYVGILGSALTYVLMAIAMRYIPASHASILLSTETLFAAAAGHVMLGERLPLLGWCGAALVMAAVLVIQLKPQSR